MEKIMKEIKQIWERHLQEAKRQKRNRQIEEFQGTIEPGVFRLFRYSRRGERTNAPEISVDPQFFKDATKRKSYSRNEWNTSAFARSFWYADPDHKERIVTGKLYYHDVPVDTIYDFKKDPEDFIEKNRHPIYRYIDWDALFAEVSKKYDGVFYTLERHGPAVVAYFKPVMSKEVI